MQSFGAMTRAVLLSGRVSSTPRTGSPFFSPHVDLTGVQQALACVTQVAHRDDLGRQFVHGVLRHTDEPIPHAFGFR